MGAARSKPSLLNFFTPVLSLIFFTWYFDVDILMGVIVALTITVALYWSQRLLSFNQVFDTSMEGFKSIIVPLGTVVAGFMLKEVNESLGLTLYIIDTVKPLMSGDMLLVVFLMMALIAFATGTFWGMLAVSLPIVLPLAQAMDAQLPLVMH